MTRLKIIPAAFACLALASMTANAQINIPGLSGSGGGNNRGNNNSGGNRGNNNNGNSNNGNNNGGGNSGNKTLPGIAKGEDDVKAKVQNGNNNNSDNNNNKNRDGINIGGRDGINIDSGKNGIQIDSQRNKDRENFNKGNNDHNNNNKNNNGHHDDLTKRSRIGDGNWDKFGIGRLEDSRYRNSGNNQWRYKKYGSDWFYWTPSGYWMYYGNNQWNRYEPDSYATYYYGEGGYQPQPVQQVQQVVPANFNGPYYEDSNGFYYLNGNQRVYDPTIRLAVTAQVN